MKCGLFFVSRYILEIYCPITPRQNNCKPPIKITAKTKDNIIMGIEIEDSKTFGVQFHPEAILTEDGMKIFENFIEC